MGKLRQKRSFRGDGDGSMTSGITSHADLVTLSGVVGQLFVQLGEGSGMLAGEVGGKGCRASLEGLSETAQLWHQSNRSQSSAQPAGLLLQSVQPVRKG